MEIKTVDGYYRQVELRELSRMITNAGLKRSMRTGYKAGPRHYWGWDLKTATITRCATYHQYEEHITLGARWPSPSELQVILDHETTYPGLLSEGFHDSECADPKLRSC